MPQPKTAPKLTGNVQPIEPSTGTLNGEPFVINPREVFAAEHPLVRAHPHLFKPVEPTRDRPGVEQMTAGPGEKRGTRASAAAR